MSEIEKKGLNIDEGFSLFSNVELEQVGAVQDDDKDVNDEIEGIELIMDEEEIDEMLDLNSGELTRSEQAEYPFLKVEGFVTEAEAIFFLDTIDSIKLDESEEAIPVVGVINGKLIKAGVMNLTFDSIIKLKVIKDYRLTLVLEKGDELTVNSTILKGLLLS